MVKGKLLFARDTTTSKRLSRQFKEGKIHRLYRGIYTTDLAGPSEQIVQKNWMAIVAHIVPKGVLSFRTAVDLRPCLFSISQSIVFITSSYNKTILLPGLIIKVIKGNNDTYIEQVLPNLAKSNTARMLLENLSSIRLKKYLNIKTLGKAGVEKYLAKELRLRKEVRLNAIRDEAQQIAQTLEMNSEYRILDQLIAALLSTNTDPDFLETPYAKALVRKEPYDIQRMQSFEKLADFLQQCNFIPRKYSFDTVSYKNIAFFESYFSNFIEGTEFSIQEAEEIISTGHEIYNRHEDSHDVLSHYYLSTDMFEMSKTPQTPGDLIEILQSRHAYLMKERPSVHPGVFKTKINRAGSTYFVEPQDVIGTLIKGFELYKLVQDGMAKALFMHFLISEVHPFNDGNGRLARIMMNAELVSAEKYKIIMPIVMRDSYITSLRRASRDQFFHTYCKVMDVAAAYTADTPWFDYSTAKEKLETDQADQDPDVGLPTFNLTIRNLNLSRYS